MKPKVFQRSYQGLTRGSFQGVTREQGRQKPNILGSFQGFTRGQGPQKPKVFQGHLLGSWNQNRFFKNIETIPIFLHLYLSLYHCQYYNSPLWTLPCFIGSAFLFCKNFPYLNPTPSFPSPPFHSSLHSPFPSFPPPIPFFSLHSPFPSFLLIIK